MDTLRALTVPQVVLVGFACLVGAGLVFAATTSATAFGAFNYAWDGSADLRGLAEDEGLDSAVVQNTTVYEQLQGTGTLVVVLGPAETYTPAETARVTSFLDDGGTLLVAGDFGGGANTLLSGIGASTRIDGGLLRDERNYGHSPAFPIATPLDNRSLGAAVSAFELNHGSVLTGTDEPGTTVLATSSPYGYIDANRNDELDARESLRTYPVMSRETVGNGSVIALSDPSVFINAMLDRQDNAALATTLFEGYERVRFDYTHAGGIPPLVQVLLTIRSTRLTRFGFGVLLLGSVLAGARFGPQAVDRLRQRRRRPEAVGLTEAEVVKVLTEQHPDWEPERIRRIAAQLVARRSDRER